MEYQGNSTDEITLMTLATSVGITIHEKTSE
jgi:hypothetical protein